MSGGLGAPAALPFPVMPPSGLLFQAQETLSAFHRCERQTSFRRRDARQQRPTLICG